MPILTEYFLKKIGVIIRPLPKFLMIKLLTIIMITLMLGPNFFFTKLLIVIIPGLLLLIEIISEEFFPFGFAGGGCILVLSLISSPLNLLKVSLFKDHFKIDAYGSKFPPILHFVKKYKIPWILKWQYVIVEDILERHWYIKWWDKFLTDNIVKNVNDLAHAPKALNLPSNTTQNLLPNAPPTLLTLDDFLPVKKASPISKIYPPTSSSSKKTSLSKKKKKALMKAFLESLDVGSDEDEDSDASSNASINP
jgi:hypothetical protein